MLIKKITLVLCMSLIAVQAIIAQTNEPTTPAGTFAWNPAAAIPGTLSRYRLTTGKPGAVNPKTLVFWVYQAEDGRIETLHDARPIGDPALYLDVWTLDPGRFQFGRHLRSNLAAKENPDDLIFDSLFDTDTKWLRTQYTIYKKDKVKVLSGLEAMPWSPMLWHRDLGMYFTAFFPHLSDGAGTFTVCLDSYSHLILMRVIPQGSETIDGIPCRKFILKGEGLLSALLHTGTVWIADGEKPRLVRQELNIRLSWTLPRFQLQLMETSKSGSEAWLALRQELTKEYSEK